jgi:uncharacterized MAPEG superfamily protein
MPAASLLLAALVEPSAPMPAGAGSAFVWSLVLSGAVVIASQIPLGAARYQADFKPSDLGAPRAMFDRLPAWGKRANWAHQNCFEAFTLHAPACLLALMAARAGASVEGIALLAAWLHPALRLLYIGVYIADLPPLRSLCWAGAILSTALLYAMGLRGLLTV